jgi:hypothetical protein
MRRHRHRTTMSAMFAGQFVEGTVRLRPNKAAR